MRITYVLSIIALSHCRNTKHFAGPVNFTCLLGKSKVNQSKPNLRAFAATFDKGPDFVCAFSSGSISHCTYFASYQIAAKV